MLVLPLEARPGDDGDVASFLGAISAGLFGEQRRGRHASALWVPSSVNRTDYWIYDAPGRIGARLRADAADGRPLEAYLAAQLVDAWSGQVMDELANG
jgi:hypothetical protein